MSRNYDNTDLKWTLNGDLSLGQSGDLADTSSDVLRSIRQEVRTRVRSSLKDWQIHPDLGANLDEIIGEPNTRETAEIGKDRIIASLTRDNLISDGDIEIQFTPVDRHAILYRMKISVSPTTANGGSEEFTEKFLFYMKDKGLKFI